MTKNISYTQLEKEFTGRFSKDLMVAESANDVKKFFARTIIKLLSRASEGRITAEEQDILLTTSEECCYVISSHLLEDESLSSFWNDSDINNIIERFAVKAMKHLKYLDKHPEKNKAQNVNHLGGR